MNNLKQMLRQLQNHPFTNGVIILTIALLIGTVCVIYASFQNLPARLTPFPEAERIVKLWRVGENRFEPLFPGTLYQEYASRLTSFDELGAIRNHSPLTLTEVGEPASYKAVAVSASLLRLIRVPPLLGRTFDAEDEANKTQVAIISEQMWRETLSVDERVIGRELRLNDRVYTVIGVMPEKMRTTRLGFAIDIWLPESFKQTSRNLTLFGRLKPGISIREAQSELDAVAPALEENYSPDQTERAVYPGGFHGARAAFLSQHLGSQGAGVSAQELFAWLFAGIVIASIVGIACFNITNLLLAREAGRSREIAIRVALGASRVGIVWQLLKETLVLAGLGGLFGMLVSFWLFDLLRFQHVDARLDWRLYLIALGGSLLLGALTGLLPALRATRGNLTDALKEGGQVLGRSRHRARNFLVGSEIAMALVLCILTAHVALFYMRLQSVDPGFDPERLVAVRVNLRNDIYREMDARHGYADRALAALRETPGVEEAAVSGSWSLLGWTLGDPVAVWPTGGGDEQVVESEISFVSHGWAGLNGMHVLRGRDLSVQSKDAMDEALVNETFAAAAFKGADPIGARIRIGRADPWATIVGVVRDRHAVTSYQGAKQPEVLAGTRYRDTISGTIFLVQTRPKGRAMHPSIRETLQRLDLNQPVNQPEAMADLLATRMAGPRGLMFTFTAMAGMGLFIALMGIYGVVAFAVMERTREVGLRLAIGATRADVLRLILWQGARLLLIGIAPGALIGSFLLAAMPRQAGLGAFEPLTLIMAVLTVTAAGVVASFLPARKAANLNPMEALRHE